MLSRLIRLKVQTRLKRCQESVASKREQRRGERRRRLRSRAAAPMETPGRAADLTLPRRRQTNKPIV